MIDFFQSLYDSFLDKVDSLFIQLLTFLQDLFITILDLFLSAIATVIENIPTPVFLSNGLASYLNGIDPAVIYFLSMSGFSQSLAIVGTGVLFRLTRKAFTLGQW